MTIDRLIGLKYWAGEDIGIIKDWRCFRAFAYFRLFSYVIFYIILNYLTTYIDSSILKRERDFANVSDLDHIQYERFRPLTVPYHFWALHDSFWAFSTVLWRSFAFMDVFIIFIYHLSNTDRKVLPKAYLH